jgi:hypothetical protein
MAEALGIAGAFHFVSPQQGLTIAPRTTASVIAVIEITKEVIALCIEHEEGVRNASRDWKKLTTELEATLDLLQRMHTLSVDGSNTQHFSTLQSLVHWRDGPYSEYKKDVTRLRDKLKKNIPLNWKTTVKRLFWPLEEKDVRKIVEGMERKKALFILALSMDNM